MTQEKEQKKVKAAAAASEVWPDINWAYVIHPTAVKGRIIK
ncbi:hypothetical protein T229_03655 [Tannerella sp. oral taxon BU063 isolate Cell 5]|uniref:Uncharacterized protein n=1 Tax=Tannerella sp. oral taxon BU063 isolate Cell 5 TaxID=1410950 RepID=W2CE65_9BACT|nr:hypothetical protein T229_03655 [Tannerella sp. oral taxon BU063 isolate Cell 5]